MTRALVAMSGGVDSSVAAALLLDAGYEVVGATMKLWGGPSDSGCCSVADVEDARRVCQQLGIDHHVFNFTAEFERDVVAPYVAAHARAATPNPCIACNAHLKFDRFFDRATLLGYDIVATGHHARVWQQASGEYCLGRGRDAAKDQSYVLYMLGQNQLARLNLPVGELTKQDVREVAASLGLRTAGKPDSQDVCFISKTAGREGFLRDRIPLGPGRLVSKTGEELGSVASLELVTVGQRRGLGLVALSEPERKYVLDVDLVQRQATVGDLEDLLVGWVDVVDMSWPARPLAFGARVQAQLSAHGRPVWATWGPPRAAGGPGPEAPARRGEAGGLEELAGPAGCGSVVFDARVRRVAPGQAVVLYGPGAHGDIVLGGGTAA